MRVSRSLCVILRMLVVAMDAFDQLGFDLCVNTTRYAWNSRFMRRCNDLYIFRGGYA